MYECRQRLFPSRPKSLSSLVGIWSVLSVFTFTTVTAGFVSGQSVGSDIVQEETVSRLSPNPPRGEHSLPDSSHEIIIQVSDADSDSSKGNIVVSIYICI